MRRKLFIAVSSTLVVLGGCFTVFAAQSPVTPPSVAHPTTKAAPTVEATVEKPVADVAVETPAAPASNDKPAPQATCNQLEDVYCYGVHGVDSYGTPIPTVLETQPNQPWVRGDGTFNYCYQMTDGSWTTVIGQLGLQKGIYYYGGSIDASTMAPAYAVESQQWCAANAPPEAL
jgi:hypothetical protein